MWKQQQGAVHYYCGSVVVAGYGLRSGQGLGKIDSAGNYWGLWTVGYSNYNVTLGQFYGYEPVFVEGGATSGLAPCGAG